MTPASQFSLLVGITVAAGGLLMVPRHSEWIAMLRDEGDEARVIAALEPALAQNPHDPQTLGTLGRAYADVGKDQAAIDLLKRYVILQPDDAEAYFTLATVYERTGDISQQTQALRDGLSLKPDAQHIRQLALLYAYQARAGEEFDLLTRFSNDLTIGSGLVVRLAELQKQRGDIAAAIETLRRADVTSDSLPPEATLRARLLLAGFLVEARQPDLLVRFGRQWIQNWGSPYFSNQLLLAILPAASDGPAFALADQVANSYPEIQFFLVKELAGIGAVSTARHLLSTWIGTNPRPSAEEIAGFIASCLDQNAPEIVWATFGVVINHTGASRAIARFADAMADQFGVGSLAPFWSRLSTELRGQRPLLMARMAYEENDPASARLVLEQIVPLDLTPADQRIWLSLLKAVAPPSSVFDYLSHLRHDGGLPALLLPEFARLAGEIGDEATYRDVLADLSQAAR